MTDIEAATESFLKLIVKMFELDLAEKNNKIIVQVRSIIFLTLRRWESVVCSYLLHGCDVIRIFKLCIEERGVSRVLLCSLKTRMMSHQV